MMDCGAGMMVGMALVGVLAIVALLLLIAGLAKYLFYS